MVLAPVPAGPVYLPIQVSSFGLEVGGNLGHVLDRHDLDLGMGLVPGPGLGALGPVADTHEMGQKQILCFATEIFPALEIFLRL